MDVVLLPYAANIEAQL